MMKRMLALLVAVLLLTGCVAAPGTTTAPTAEPTEAPTLPSLYDPENPIEADSGGAVRAYTLDPADYTGIYRMGEDILLVSGTDGAVLTRLSGEDGTVTASAQVTGKVTRVWATDRALGYYDDSSRTVVLLDADLRETNREQLPETLQGMPLLSPALDSIYYCTDSEIRAMNLDTGISRLVKQQQTQWQSLLGFCFDGSVISCAVVETGGESYIAFLSAETGEVLDLDSQLWGLETWNDAYFVQRTDGTVDEHLFGTRGGDIRSLNPADDGTIIPALSAGGAYTAFLGICGLDLTYYDLETGARQAYLELNGVAYPEAYLAGDDYFWFISQFEGEDALYRWDRSMSQTQDETVYTSPRYTASAPDTVGLAACQKLANDIGSKYGVDIRVGASAVKVPSGYELTQEYQVEAFYRGLESLDQALSKYPEGFFRTLARGTDSEMLHIGLVRDISSDRDGVQYWGEKDAYIALVIGENLEQAFYHEVSHVLDTLIFTETLAYDDWEQLNPDDFSYFYSYDDYQDNENSAYLEGEDRAFVDAYSMTFPMEDRARILEYAMTADNSELFASQTMQNKLRQICEGIREAFGWEESTETFLWEQYLLEEAQEEE